MNEIEKVKFIHIADTHLGYNQYNIPERYEDFLNVFNFILEKSIENKVDFILLSGDMFNDSKVNPETLTDIYYSILDFKDKSKKILHREIRIIAIEGNHDSPIFSSQSWMKFLADLKMIILLSGDYDAKNRKITFSKILPGNNRGGMISIKNCNIYGLSYFGSNTPQLFPLISQSIVKNNDEFNILMMHFGIAGLDKKKTGIPYTKEFESMNNSVDYLALGHFHTMYTYPPKNSWIYNPGSLEVNDIKEYDINKNHGAFLVELDSENITKPIITELLCANGYPDHTYIIPNRMFISTSSYNVGVSKPSNFQETIEDVINSLKIYGLALKNKVHGPLDKKNLNLPIIALNLFGMVPYSRLEFNTRLLREEILKRYNLLDIRIYNSQIQSKLDGLAIESDDELSLDVIEKQVFSMIIDNDKQFEPIKDNVVSLMMDIKEKFSQPKPNISNLSNTIKEWYKNNTKFLNDVKNPLEKSSLINNNDKKNKSDENHEKSDKEITDDILSDLMDDSPIDDDFDF